MTQPFQKIRPANRGLRHQLVGHGIVSKTSFDQKALKVEYSLTPLGETLIPIIELTAKWGEAHRELATFDWRDFLGRFEYILKSDSYEKTRF